MKTLLFLLLPLCSFGQVVLPNFSRTLTNEYQVNYLTLLKDPLSVTSNYEILVRDKGSGTIKQISSFPKYINSITAENGLNGPNDSTVSMGGNLTQNTSIYGNSYNLNLYPSHLNIGNADFDQTSAKMAVSLDSTASGPNTTLGVYYTGTDPLLSNAWGYNALYAVGSVKFTTDPVATSSYTFLAPILGKFTIPESTGSHYINSSASPVSSVAAVLNSENGNIGMSDFAFFYGGNNTLDPVKDTYTGHIDTLYGLFVTDPFAGQMGDSIRRAYGIYLGGSATFNYLAGHSGFGINTPTSAVDINGTSTDTGADLLRIRKSYTPTGTDDTAGQTGSISWDDSYIYVKTSSGWKRAALTTF